MDRRVAQKIVAAAVPGSSTYSRAQLISAFQVLAKPLPSWLKPVAFTPAVAPAMKAPVVEPPPEAELPDEDDFTDPDLIPSVKEDWELNSSVKQDWDNKDNKATLLGILEAYVPGGIEGVDLSSYKRDIIREIELFEAKNF